MSAHSRPSVPFLDLVTPHVQLEDELVAAFRAGLRSGNFVGGAVLEEFEQQFARSCDTRYGVGVGSGTDALRFALMAAGIGAGDAVITVPNTFIATAEAISQAGALPVFVDVDESTYNLDPKKLASFLQRDCSYYAPTRTLVHERSGRRVAAIVPVHLYGQMADMDPILALAEQYGLHVIEDACQAHGAAYYSRQQGRWCKAGSMGMAAAFSFYPGKNLGACGEAGAVVTNHEPLANQARQLRDHGQSRKYHHQVEGYNGRMDSLQAAFLLVKLKHLEDWNERRREVAKDYHRLFESCSQIAVPQTNSWTRSVYHLYVVRVVERDRVQAELAAAGVGTGIHYPIPLHLQPAYAALGHQPGDFPITESAAPEILSLPMYPQLKLDAQEHVVETVMEALTRSRRPLATSTTVL